jgi:hypothetical protein
VNKLQLVEVLKRSHSNHLVVQSLGHARIIAQFDERPSQRQVEVSNGRYGEMPIKRMSLRYAGKCRSCGAALEARTTAFYDSDSKTVSCLGCGVAARRAPSSLPPPPAIERGVAGAGPQLEYARRVAKREAQLDKKWGRLAPVAKFLSDEPQSIDYRLFVNNRDRTALVDGMQRQVDAVRSALDPMGLATLPVHPALVFTNSEWGLFAKPFDIKGVRILWAKRLCELVVQAGSIEPTRIDSIARQLSSKLPPKAA